MRIVSQDGTRDFPYDSIALMLRTRWYEDNEIYVITALFNGNEYDMGYFKDMNNAYIIMKEIRNMPEYYYDEDDDFEEDDDDFSPFFNESKILCVVIPKEEKMTADK